MRTFKLATLSNFHILSTVLFNCSHHAACYIPISYFFYNWKFVPKKQNILRSPKTSRVPFQSLL